MTHGGLLVDEQAATWVRLVAAWSCVTCVTPMLLYAAHQSAWYHISLQHHAQPCCHALCSSFATSSSANPCLRTRYRGVI